MVEHHPLRSTWKRVRGEESQNQEPDWARILSAMYQAEVPENQEVFRKTQYVYDTRTLAVTTNLSERRVSRAGRKLQDWGLTERELKRLDNESSYMEYSLTKEGFEVAHERELSNKSDRINQSLVFFTFVLVVAEIVGIMPVGRNLSLFMGFIILIGMTYVVLWTDAMD